VVYIKTLAYPLNGYFRAFPLPQVQRVQQRQHFFITSTPRYSLFILGVNQQYTTSSASPYVITSGAHDIPRIVLPLALSIARKVLALRMALTAAVQVVTLIDPNLILIFSGD